MAGKYDTLPLPHSDKLAPSIVIRAATKDDVKAMKHSFFNSFTPTHPFWPVAFPESLYSTWWDEAWLVGIQDDPTARTFIAIDSSVSEQDAGNFAVKGGRIVGFTRWIVPQHNGELHRLWPDLPAGSDMEILGPFFSGMANNREKLMGGKPHWFLEMLGTDVNYHRTGVGYAFVDWGCQLADKEDMDVYIDASEMGAPFYQKRFGAQPREVIEIPKRPETYGEFRYVSHVRPKLSEREKSS